MIDFIAFNHLGETVPVNTLLSLSELPIKLVINCSCRCHKDYVELELGHILNGLIAKCHVKGTREFKIDAYPVNMRSWRARKTMDLSTETANRSVVNQYCFVLGSVRVNLQRWAKLITLGVG